jgi:hypothetical protein
VASADDWPFADPPSVATITVRQIVDDGRPILLVTHDADDGTWQFLTDGPVSMTDALVIGLANMLKRDPSLAQLADLPLGWRAWRESPDEAWERAPSPADNE